MDVAAPWGHGALLRSLSQWHCGPAGCPAPTSPYSAAFLQKITPFHYVRRAQTDPPPPAATAATAICCHLRLRLCLSLYLCLNLYLCLSLCLGFFRFFKKPLGFFARFLHYTVQNRGAFGLSGTTPRRAAEESLTPLCKPWMQQKRRTVSHAALLELNRISCGSCGRPQTFCGASRWGCRNTRACGLRPAHRTWRSCV